VLSRSSTTNICIYVLDRPEISDKQYDQLAGRAGIARHADR
jgi:NAD-dependent DNA ligase